MPLIALALLLHGGLASAGRAPAADRPPRCTAARAQATTVEAIQAAITSWEGHCVRIGGLGTPRRLPIPHDETPAARSIVINARGHMPHPRRPRWIELIGTVGSCRRENAALVELSAARPDQIIMLMGLCHTSLENYVRTVAIRVLSNRPIPRLTEAEVPQARRELVDAPENLAGRAKGIEAARSMLAAIQSRDEASFIRLAAPDPAGRDEAGADFRHATAAASAFAALPPVPDRQERVFVDRRQWGEALRQPHDHGIHPALITCWCRTSDCSGRWPVRALDADNDPSRPYACIATNDYIVFRQGSVIQATAKVEPNGFAER